MNIDNLYNVLSMVENMFNTKNGDGIDMDLQKQLLQAKGQAIDAIRKYPIGSLAAAIAVGFIIGKIIKK